MQKDNYQDFDREIRSMLEDAAVKPPRRVWKSVVRRIDTEETAGMWVWMRWAGVGFAAAAAVLAVVLFVGRKPAGDIRILDTVQDTGLTAEVQTEEWIDEKTEPELLAFAAPAPVRTLGSVEAAVAEEVAEEVVVGEVVETVAETEAVTEQEEFEDAMPLEWDEKGYDNPFSRRVQLYAQGIVTGNDADFNYSRRGGSYAYGVTIPKTGITELGESYYGIPFSVGLGLRFYVSPRFAIGTGLEYSMVTRTFRGEYINLEEKIDETGDISHTMHYLGIPLNLYYDFVSAERVRVYVTGGAEAEYCIANRYSLTTTSTFNYSTRPNGVQWSAGAGLGVEFRITRGFGLYFDPGVRYYFNCNQPKSIRTDKPLMVNLDAGLRFDF